MNRRNLIKKLAIAGTAIMTASAATSGQTNENSKDEKIGYAVLGLGGFAGYVLPRLRSCEKSRIAALISSDAEKARQWIERHKLTNCEIYSYNDFEKISQNKTIDAIYIATPVGTHAEFALKSFAAGKHVLTEKTMAATVAEGQSMIDAAQKAGKKLMIGYRARYEPYNQACIDFVKNETYGKVTSIAAHKGFFIGDRLGKENWRIKKNLAGGGALVDIGIYSIQACRYLAGAEPIEVFGFSESTANDPRFTEVEENLSFILKFPNGILATGSASWNYALQNYFRVGAAKGYFELEPATSNNGLRMIVRQENPVFVGERFFPDVDQIPAMFDHFSSCLLENKEPKTNGEEGLKDLLVIDAIYRSIRENKPLRL